MIPMNECIHGGVYLLRSRNLLIGAWNAEKQGFAGVREKFKERYIFMEFHIEAPAFATADPLALVCMLPESLEPVEGWWDTGKYVSNTDLLNYLDLADRALSARRRL